MHKLALLPSQSTDETADTQIWISKSRGLPLKQISDLEVGADGKRRTEVRYEYTNVTVPVLTEAHHK